MVCDSFLCWLNTINSFFNYRYLTKQLLNDSWWTGWKQLDLIMLICNFNMLSKKNIEVGWSFTDALSNRIEFGWFLLAFLLDYFL